MKVAVFASGNGSNFAAIARAVKRRTIRVKLVALVCDQPQARVIRRAQNAGVPVILARREDFASRNDFEAAIIQRLKDYGVELIALAGFMRMLSPRFVGEYRNRIINIHPALLPAFKGSRAIKDALIARASFTGATVHFVDEQMDHGPVILQQKILIRAGDTLASLEKRVHAVEHKIYPQAIRLFSEGRIKVKGGKAVITARRGEIK